MNIEGKKEKVDRTHVIINPVSAGGKTGAKQPEILSALDRRIGKGYSLCVTSRPLEAGFSARNAIMDGSKLIIAIGGDGTIQETVNGFYSDGRLINPSCQLGIIDSGTGHGFAQSLDLPAGLDEQLEVIQRGETRSIDIGRATFSGDYGERREHYFVNECQAGSEEKSSSSSGRNTKGWEDLWLLARSPSCRHCVIPAKQCQSK